MRKKLLTKYLLFFAGSMLVYSTYHAMSTDVETRMHLNPGDGSTFNYVDKYYGDEPRELTLKDLEEEHPDVELLREEPVKIYVYNLSSEFNKDISSCIQSPSSSPNNARCFDYSNHGFGKLLYKDGRISIHNTNQFSLDFIIHEQIVNSRYYTDNPKEASIFYVPIYIGSSMFCKKQKYFSQEQLEKLFKHLNTMPYYAQGKPHVFSLAKIEREQTDQIKAHPGLANMTYIVIEKTENIGQRSYFGLDNQKTIVAPYPSYIHFDFSSKQHIPFTSLADRNIFLFLAASLRRSNRLRAAILDQFFEKTKLSYDQFKSSAAKETIEQMMLITTECAADHPNTTIRWMQHSTFCLQPHGDSPTRKSFYDSILSGCIPVVLHIPGEVVEFPFQHNLNYDDFIVRIPMPQKREEQYQVPMIPFLRQIPETEIKRLHHNLRKVFALFQYTVINNGEINNHDDAMHMIVKEIRQIYNV